MSAFHIEKTNVLATDPANPGFSAPIGQARSRGFEADANFRASRRFDVTVVHAYVDADVLPDDPPNPNQQIAAGPQLSNVLRHSASLFAQWQLSDAEAGYFILGRAARIDGVGLSDWQPEILVARHLLGCAARRRSSRERNRRRGGCDEPPAAPGGQP